MKAPALSRSYFKFYGKKRGERRTGSSQMGSLGTSLFFGLFFLVGCVALAVILTMLVIPEWQVNHDYIAHRCTVLDTRIGESRGDDGMTYRPELRIAYELNGRKYDIWTTHDVTGVYLSGRQYSVDTLAGFEKNAEYECWYDPREPGRAVMVRGYSWFAWLMLLFPIPFLVMGGGGLIANLLYGGHSAERMAATSSRSKERELFSSPESDTHRLPSVPKDVDVVNSAGTQLKYRLPAASLKFSVWAMLAFTLIWNSIAGVMVYIVWRSSIDGDLDWFFLCFVTFAVLIGCVLLCLLMRQIMVTAGVAPTIVEISDHPLIPGQSYELLVSQRGRLSLNSLQVRLVCDEDATYRQGTDTHTANHRVVDLLLYGVDGLEIPAGMPWETRCRLVMPDSAMHSFDAENNKIGWKVLILGDVAGWPNFERAFRVIVHPRSAVGQEQHIEHDEVA